LRVGVFSDCYLPAINGVVTSICQQVEVLRAMGHEVDLYCPQYASRPEGEHQVHRLWAKPFPFHKREQMTFPWPPSLLKQIWTKDYDLFHIQTPFSVGLIGLLAAFTRRIPRIFHHHTLWEEYVDYLPIPKSVSARGSVALCRGLANRCQGVIAPSAQVRDLFAGQGVKTPMSVIPTGIKADRFQGGNVREERQNGESVCLYMGRLAHEKSLDSLIRVFDRIHGKNDSARLWLVGDGPARADLERQVADLGLSAVCRFFGFVDRDTLRDYVASAQVFLFTSLTETQGLVLLEAQAGGLPVVAFEASGVNEAVDPGATGFLVEEGREDLMAQAALRILDESDLREELSKAGLIWSANFSVERMGEALVSTYERAMESTKNRRK
jgi:1,2-diacylglycerol 3-alpha-glucosyltransferase